MSDGREKNTGKPRANRLGSLTSPGGIGGGPISHLDALSQAMAAGGASHARDGHAGNGASAAPKPTKRFIPVGKAKSKVKQEPGTGEGADSGQGPSTSAADKGIFDQLRAAAKGKEREWAGRGRGRGGRGWERQDMKFNVTFTNEGAGAARTGRTGVGSSGTGTSGGGGIGLFTGDGGGFGRPEEKRKEAKQKGMLNEDVYYPTVLPLLDGAGEVYEGGNGPDAVPPDLLSLGASEDIDAAQELGLAPGSSSDPEQLMLFQLPQFMPSVDGHQPGSSRQAQAGVPLNRLPAGKIGKLLVFESGAVKMQIGDALLDVLPGAACHFRQEVAAVVPSTNDFLFLGDVAQRAVCAPNLEHLLGGDPVPNWVRTEGSTQSAPASGALTTRGLSKVKVKDEDGGAAPMDVDGR